MRLRAPNNKITIRQQQKNSTQSIVLEAVRWGEKKRAQQNNSFILSIRQHKNDVGTTMGCCVFFWVGCCCLFCFDMFSVSVCHILIAGEQNKSETDSLNVHKPRRRAQFWLSYHLEANCRRRITTKNKKKINKLMLDAHTHTHSPNIMMPPPTIRLKSQSFTFAFLFHVHVFNHFKL